MPGYVITSVFEVSGGKTPLGADVLAQAWGTGHRFSYCDGRMLTLVVELTAVDRASAFEALLSRAELVWTGLGHPPLPPPITLRVQGAVAGESVVAGIVGTEPATFAQRVHRLAKRRNIVSLRDELVVRWLDEDGPPEPPDDGGLAGVREPRRPRPGPGGISAELEPPPVTSGERPGDPQGVHQPVLD